MQQIKLIVQLFVRFQIEFRGECIAHQPRLLARFTDVKPRFPLFGDVSGRVIELVLQLLNLLNRPLDATQLLSDGGLKILFVVTPQKLQLGTGKLLVQENCVFEIGKPVVILRGQ